MLVTALNAKAARKALPVNPAAAISFRTGKVKPVAAGVDMEVVSEILGLASSAFTADVYTSVPEELAEQAAAAIAAFIPRKVKAVGSDARSSDVPAQTASEAGLSRGFD